jgi:hypothetical protein
MALAKLNSMENLRFLAVMFMLGIIFKLKYGEKSGIKKQIAILVPLGRVMVQRLRSC